LFEVPVGEVYFIEAWCNPVSGIELVVHYFDIIEEIPFIFIVGDGYAL